MLTSHSIFSRLARCTLAFVPTLLGASLAFTSPVQAEPAATMGETSLAVSGVGRVNAALPAERHLVFSASAMPGWVENFDDNTGGMVVLGGSLALAYSPLPEISVGLSAKGRLDHASVAGWSASGIPGLFARGTYSFNELISAGLQGELDFVGGEAPATTYWARGNLLAMATLTPSDASAVSLQAGVLLDASDGQLLEDYTLPVADRVTLNAASAPGVMWGVGLSQRFGSLPTEWLAETSGQILVGAKAPPFMQSPWWISLGARHPLTDSLSIMGRVEASLSSRPESVDTASLETQPFPARLSAELTLTYRPLLKRHVSGKFRIEGQKKAVAQPEEPAPIARSKLSGKVVDEGGRALPDVEVDLLIDGAKERSERTYADGSFAFDEMRDDTALELTVRTPGYEPRTIEIGPGKDRVREVILYPALPAGQVKGTVKTLQGEPLSAKITITETDKNLLATSDGSFEFELAPGKYTILFEHDDFSTQKRTISVEERGVVILNIALAK